MRYQICGHDDAIAAFVFESDCDAMLDYLVNQCGYYWYYKRESE